MARRIVVLAAIVLLGAGPARGSSPAPGTLVFFSQRNVGGGLYAESVAGGPLRQLQTGLEDGGAFWAPDGQHYLFLVPGTPVWEAQLWIADSNGRHRHLIARNAGQPSCTGSRARAPKAATARRAGLPTAGSSRFSARRAGRCRR